MSSWQCNVNDQFPAGKNSAFGTPVSVANVAKVDVVFAATFVVDVFCAFALGEGLHCLYVGVPNAELVLVD